MPSSLYFNKPSRKKYHNLCTHKSPTEGAEELLRLGHKLVIQKRKSQPNIKKVLKTLRRDVQLKYLFAGEDANKKEYRKRHDIKSEFLRPPGNKRGGRKNLAFLQKNNLGPTIIEREECVKRALKDHLGDEKPYKQLTDVESKAIFCKTRNTVIGLRRSERMGDNLLQKITRHPKTQKASLLHTV
eukprot:15332624-Ditylum_brightwellii.AAC.1